MAKNASARTGVIAHWRLPMIAFAAGCMLAGCSSFSTYVSDRWPTWAGGEPNDVPPRPGQPGYEEFISHQEAKDQAAAASAAAKPGAPPAFAAVPGSSPRAVVQAPEIAPATAPKVSSAAAQTATPLRRPDDQAAVQGGLY